MVREFLVSKRKIDDGRISTMYHAIPPEKYVPIPESRIRQATESLGAGDKTRIVGTVTKLGPQRTNLM